MTSEQIISQFFFFFFSQVTWFYSFSYKTHWSIITLPILPRNIEVIIVKLYRRLSLPRNAKLKTLSGTLPLVVPLIKMYIYFKAKMENVLSLLPLYSMVLWGSWVFVPRILRGSFISGFFSEGRQRRPHSFSV